MNLDAKTVIGLPVATRTGTALGKIQTFSLDPTTQAVDHYVVRPHGIFNDIIKSRELVVHASQVVSITEEKMTVDDLVVGEQEKMRRIAKAAPSLTS